MPSLPTDHKATDAQSKDAAVLRFPAPAPHAGAGTVNSTPRYPALAPVNPSPRPSSRSLPTYIDVSDRSSWISGFGYHNTYLVVFFKSGSATLYHNVPAMIPGLLTAGHTNAKSDGELSVGATYNRLVKGVYEGVTVSDPEKVRELRTLMGAHK